MTPGPDKQFDREQVLERAMELFWSQGYEATGMTQLLDHVGIGRQSLYNTFGDKKSLFLEALGLYFEQRISIARSLMRAKGSPLGNLRAFFEEMIRMAGEMGYCGCLMGNSLAEFGRRDREVGDAIAGFLGRLQALFAETLVRARDAGELPEDAPIDDLAQVLLVTAQGMALLSRLRPDEAESRRLLDTSFAMFSGLGATV